MLESMRADSVGTDVRVGRRVDVRVKGRVGIGSMLELMLVSVFLEPILVSGS
jgi:hypothetical protein